MGRGGRVVCVGVVAAGLATAVALAGPVAEDLSATTDAGIAVMLTLRATHDADIVVAFSITTPPAHGTLGPIGPVSCTYPGGQADCTASVTYTPVASFSGSDGFTYEATAQSLTSPAAATITVNAASPIMPDDALIDLDAAYIAVVAHVVVGAVVDYGDGTTRGLAVQDDGTAPLDHVYATEGTFRITVTNPGGLTATTLVNVLLPGATDAGDAIVLPGEAHTLKVGATLDATLTVGSSSSFATTLIGAVYPPDSPGFITVEPTLAAFDLRTIDASAQDRLVVTFTYPEDIDAHGVPTLLFFYPPTNGFELVQGSQQVPDSMRVDRVQHTLTV